MKQPTNKRSNTWLARCREANCNEVRVKCPVCGHGGHISPHVLANGSVVGIKENFDVEIAIQHSHFLENQDAGRNMYCNTKKVLVKPSDVIITWRLTRNARRWLIDRFVGEYTKK